jgi:hypothetical protein
MKQTRIRDTTRLAVTISAVLSLAACSHDLAANAKPGEVVGWSNAKNPPSGLAFSNGMPPSSNGPSPAWYAKRFGLARGLGEAVKDNRRSLWDRDDGTFVYYMGGILAAHYHPWEHYLKIITDKKGENNTVCYWAADGILTVTTTDKTPAPAGAEDTCKQLLGTLEKHVAPEGLASSGS